MEKYVVYSAKVPQEHIQGARKFFSRAGLLLQEAVRAQLRIAARCEECLELIEAKAPIERIQSSFASILADAKESWRMSGMFHEVILKVAELCNMPQDFINNVLEEAQRLEKASVQPQQAGAPKDSEEGKSAKSRAEKTRGLGRVRRGK